METEYFYCWFVCVLCLFDLANCGQLVCLLTSPLQGEMELDFLLFVGWEYGVNPTYGVYGPVMKAYHMCRRRRLVRSRELVDAKATKKQVETSRVNK